MRSSLALAFGLFLALPGLAGAQSAPPAQSTAGSVPAPKAPEGGVVPPADYTIGPEDVLTVFVWREKDLTADVVVRPDGKVSLPLLNDVDAAGLTPEQFRVRVAEAVSRYVESPTVTIVVKAINSRKIYITGQVERPGAYPLGSPINVMQLLAIAGGLREYADGKNIAILRAEPNGTMTRLKFNYREFEKGRRPEQNVILRPGDTVVVP